MLSILSYSSDNGIKQFRRFCTLLRFFRVSILLLFKLLKTSAKPRQNQGETK